MSDGCDLCFDQVYDSRTKFTKDRTQMPSIEVRKGRQYLSFVLNSRFQSDNTQLTTAGAALIAHHSLGPPTTGSRAS